MVNLLAVETNRLISLPPLPCSRYLEEGEAMGSHFSRIWWGFPSDQPGLSDTQKVNTFAGYDVRQGRGLILHWVGIDCLQLKVAFPRPRIKAHDTHKKQEQRHTKN